MDRSVEDDEFVYLCQKYAELKETKERLMAQRNSSKIAEPDNEKAEQIDDLDAQQRILMWRILCFSEQAAPVHEGRTDDDPVVSVQLREMGGTARGRFALRGIAGILKAPFGNTGTRSG